MTHLVTKIFGSFSDRPDRSNNGLAMFCALVCILLCSFSLFTSYHQEAEPTEEFFELAVDLKMKIEEFDEAEAEFHRASSKQASHTEEN